MAQVGRSATLLGFAGLLPQGLAVVLALIARGGRGDLVGVTGPMLALIYGLAILSFLGGIWWGLAMRRGATAQGGLAAMAVVPSLVGVALVAGLWLGLPLGWTLVALGSAIMLTLPVDRHLTTTGDAPPDWMGLRIPLSLGLGALTILAGTIAG